MDTIVLEVWVSWLLVQLEHYVRTCTKLTTGSQPTGNQPTQPPCQLLSQDLKPENVLLKVDKSSPIGVVAKISDFGLAKAISPHESHLSGVRGGTPFYQVGWAMFVVCCMCCDAGV